MSGKMKRASPTTTRLVGGAICLDLANTVDWTEVGDERPDHTDALSTPQDLSAWGHRLGLAPAEDLPMTGLQLKAIRRLRMAIHRTFASIAVGGTPAAQVTAALMSQYAEATAAGLLDPGADRWTIAWAPHDLRRIRFAAAVSAVELLSDATRLTRVRICPGNNCGWLFIDTTGRRRWCSMEVCGSRAKMRRLHARRRTQTQRHAG
jgi:predicted RNA-binding Zn ribbon-like protein